MSVGPSSILARIIVAIIGFAICLFIILYLIRRKRQQKPVTNIIWLIIFFVIGVILILAGLSIAVSR